MADLSTWADSDGDGLSSYEEYRNGTSPTMVDSDGDGVGDRAEVLQASNPADKSDGGRPPSADQVAHLNLSIGDTSGSWSEKYMLIVGSVSLKMNTFGGSTNLVVPFRIGQEYEVRVIHLGSTGSPPDYDYVIDISPVASTNGDGIKLIRKDPAGLLNGGDDKTAAFFENEAAIIPLRVELVPDFNHDREITDNDKSLLSSSGPFHFWINDDADRGNISEGDSDVPGHVGGLLGKANYGNSHVDGRSDLLDFFPVWLNLSQTLDFLPPSGTVQYKLKQADGAVRALYSGLTKGQAGNFLTTEGNVYGRYPLLYQNSYEADTFEVTASGATLSMEFLNKIQNDATKGILLLEGTKATTAPLVLEIWKDGLKICEQEMPLSINGVETMVRWINLRHVTGGSETRATDTREPPNNPDALSNGKQFVFVHGYNRRESGARGWNAEVFKRLYWSGSRAMFTAVTWYGDETPGILPPGAYYHADVINAFQTASALASAVAALPGQKYVAAHSLGNMVVFQRHGGSRAQSRPVFHDRRRRGHGGVQVKRAATKRNRGIALAGLHEPVVGFGLVQAVRWDRWAQSTDLAGAFREHSASDQLLLLGRRCVEQQRSAGKHVPSRD